MARRGGKANTRKSRQKRAGQRPPAAPQRVQAPSPAELPQPTAPARDAFEEADAEVRAAATAAQKGNRPARPRPGVARVASAIGPSRLTANAAAEYHYVVRDLRNIGVLVVVMAILLAVATVVVHLLGIGQP